MSATNHGQVVALKPDKLHAVAGQHGWRAWGKRIELGSDGASLRETRLHHDAAGRLTSTSVTDPTGTLLTTREELDAFGNASVLRRFLDGVEESREEWSFDARGRPIGRETFVFGSSIAALSFGWDDDGVLHSISGLQSGTLDYERSAWSGNDSLVDRLRVNGATVAEVTGRDGELRPTDLSLSGVHDLSLAYDVMGRITDRDAVSLTPASFPGISWTGQYDERGRLADETLASADGTGWSVYDYVEPGWLVGSTSSESGLESSRTWTHDAGGRRESSTIDGATEHTLGWGGSALVDIDGAALTLDPFDGVIGDDRGLSFTRDPAGALAELQVDTEVFTLTRDPQGWPIAQDETSGTRTTTYGFSGDSPLESTAGDGSVALNLSLGGLRLGQLRDGAPLGLFEDTRGALRQIGAEILPDPGPFGEDAALPTTLDERQVFAGLEALPGVDGVLLARHRELDTRTGAWLSPDPLGLDGGLHRQRYAEGDPIGFVDPLGLTAAPILHSFGDSTPGSAGVWEGPSTAGSPGGGGACTFSERLCGGQQAGRRSLVLHGDDPPETEVDAGESARERRREQRRERSTGIRDILDEHGHPGLEIRGGAGGLSSRLADLFATARNALRGEFYDIRGGVREGLGGLGEGERLAGLRQGWWTRELPAGTEGGWGPSPFRAFWHGRDAALLNYAADAVENLPGLLKMGGLAPLSGTARSALERTGWVDALRERAVAEYRAGLQEDETWTAIGGWSGFSVAVLTDFAMPGPGGEGKAAERLLTGGEEVLARVETRIVDEMAEQVTKRGEGIIEEAAHDGLIESSTTSKIASPWGGFKGTQSTRGQASSRKIATIAEDMRQHGWRGEPIRVYERDGVLYIVDGHHRAAAARAAGITDVPYEEVTLTEALLLHNVRTIEEFLSGSDEVP